MPNWSDDTGRYRWKPPGKQWYETIEIPHAPVVPKKNCKCAFCVHERLQRKIERFKRKAKRLYNDFSWRCEDRRLIGLCLKCGHDVWNEESMPDTDQIYPHICHDLTLVSPWSSKQRCR